MGVENQVGVHYYMPVRCMELDALSYASQCKNISIEIRENETLEKYAEYMEFGLEKE